MKRIFFRNDDLGWNLEECDRLVELCKKYAIKMNMAAIPTACKDHYRANPFIDLTDVIQVHSHGYTHLDHQTEGKKAEFGSSRDISDAQSDLEKSFEIISQLFKENYVSAFTPPWNRIDTNIIPLLPEVGFTCLSRDGDKKANIDGLKEINVNIDLHTSKDPAPTTLEELEKAINEISQPDVGIMIHHKHMSQSDFEFLETVFNQYQKEDRKTYFFSELK